jgi:hypothetical protein
MRWWLLSREEARELARAHVEARRLPWTEPVKVMRRPLGGWEVMTNSDHRGGNVFVWVSRRGRISGGEGVTQR